MIVGIGKNKWIGMEKLNHLKETYIISNRKNFKKGPYKAQEAIDKILEYLNKFASEQSTLWDYRAVARWGKAPATEKQINYAKRLLKGKGKKVNLNIMTKEELATIISYAKMYN
jgi:DNA-directed RNA polymerase sigma subunit (sigma70/sigma32)